MINVRIKKLMVFSSSENTDGKWIIYMYIYYESLVYCVNYSIRPLKSVFLTHYQMTKF